MIEQIKSNCVIVTTSNVKCDSILEYETILELVDIIQYKYAMFDEVYWVIANTGTKYPISYKDILNINIGDYKKKVLIWIGEESGQLPPKQIVSIYDVIFKSYMKSDLNMSKVYALPLITPKIPLVDFVPFEKRKYNVFYSGNLNKNRVSLYLSLNPNLFWGEKFASRFYKIKGGTKLFNLLYNGKEYDFSYLFENSILKFNNGFYTGFSRDEYINITANSKIILSPKGFASPECFRLYEAMKYGCVVITEVLPIVSFYENIPVLQVSNWNDVHALIKSILSNKAYLNEISNQAVDFYNKKMSINAIVDYIIDRL